ncbi:MAG: hypothetical protein HQ521_18905, partial [Bacteroidetes bacterium]|nr:hypothetical protein [Bacteroidota bacterium]
HLHLGLSATYNNFDELSDKNNLRFHRIPSSLKRGRSTFGGSKIYWLTVKITFLFEYKNFNYLISSDFIELIKKYYTLLLKDTKLKSYKLLLVPNDTDFFSRIFIKIFRELNRPTILVSHGGMPTLYDKFLDNRTDFIFMRNAKEVESYIKMGYDPKKFFITGHPFYKVLPKAFRFNFDDVLIITKSVNGVCPLDQPHLEDRGNIIMFLYAIQNSLIKLGISKVRLRPHPSENADWYLSFVDRKFFHIDNESLTDSLKKSTLVIGPTSTVIIDAMAHAVNYTIFEPTINGKLLTGFPVTPPLDGSDPRIPIARNEEELLAILQNRQCIDISVYKEFADPNFDISFIKEILDDWRK